MMSENVELKSSQMASTFEVLEEEKAKKQAVNKSRGKENQERLCFECNKPLSKSRQIINIAGKAHKWHPECFKCNVCSLAMEKETSCYIYKEKIVCRNDYSKLVRDKSTKCARCGWQIASSDWVRKAGEYVYHLTCFSCDICMRQLSTGEQFTIDIQQEKNSQIRLLCRLHFAIDSSARANNNHSNKSTFQANNEPRSVALDERSSSPRAVAFDDSPSTFSYRVNQQCSKYYHNQDQYLHMLAATTSSASHHHHQLLMNQQQQQRVKPLNQNGAPFVEDLMHQISDEIGSANQLASQRIGGASTSSSSNGSTSGIIGLPSKSKRVRTTFTEDQLAILQTHFQIDSNPDGQDLERIATITGLSKRVTQVWFQNSRARQKKYMIKRKPSGSQSVCNPTTSSTCTASSSSGQTTIAIGLTNQFLAQNQDCSYPVVGNSSDPDRRQQRWSNVSSDLSIDGATQNALAMEDTEDEETRTTNSTENDEERLVISDEEEGDSEDIDDERGVNEEEEDSAD